MLSSKSAGLGFNGCFVRYQASRSPLRLNLKRNENDVEIRSVSRYPEIIPLGNPARGKDG